ncbi:hypothetical protein HQQ80_00630 [Microbacteriaceae bacterium VKM Ac-2855]|nr:hypothetical protein [Microbacteriaceae bacterium VKM Ac-2855]
MTVQHDETPLTRRELRERERSAAGAAAPSAAPTTSRRAATTTSTVAGDTPVIAGPPVSRAVPVEPTPSEAPELRDPVTPARDSDTAPERTLTRRELRALLAQQQAQQVAALPDVNESAPDDDVAEDSIPGGDERADDSTPRPVSAAIPVITLFERPPGDDPSVAGSTGETASASTGPAEDEPKLHTALFASIGSGALDDGEAKPTEITGSFTVPIEHLHITEELDNKARGDADVSFDALIAQGVASTAAVTTTNALILPTITSAPSAGGPDTGEVLVTGTIDLPRSLGSTGQHPNLYDSPDVDRMFDRVDRDQAPADSVPVRASSAISTHTSTRGVIAPQQKKGVSLPVVLAITAAALLVGVVVLLVGGFVLNIF